MKWTTDKPTEPGFYWVRWASPYEGTRAEVVEVEQSERFGWLLYAPGDEIGRTIDGITHWAGPIEPPEDA